VVQRCQVHKLRNVRDLLNEARQAYVARQMRDAYSSVTASTAKKKFLQLASWPESNGEDSAAVSLREGTRRDIDRSRSPPSEDVVPHVLDAQHHREFERDLSPSHPQRQTLAMRHEPLLGGTRRCRRAARIPTHEGLPRYACSRCSSSPTKAVAPKKKSRKEKFNLPCYTKFNGGRSVPRRAVTLNRRTKPPLSASAELPCPVRQTAVYAAARQTWWALSVFMLNTVDKKSQITTAQSAVALPCMQVRARPPARRRLAPGCRWSWISPSKASAGIAGAGSRLAGAAPWHRKGPERTAPPSGPTLRCFAG
jgi:hypothetical protein